MYMVFQCTENITKLWRVNRVKKPKYYYSKNNSSATDFTQKLLGNSSLVVAQGCYQVVAQGCDQVAAQGCYQVVAQGCYQVVATEWCCVSL